MDLPRFCRINNSKGFRSGELERVNFESQHRFLPDLLPEPGPGTEYWEWAGQEKADLGSE